MKSTEYRYLDQGACELLVNALARVIERQRGASLPPSGSGKIEIRIASVCFQALVEMIDSNSGVGFVNADQGHPAYAMGRRGKIDAVAGGDGPKTNTLFKLLQRFPPVLHEQIQDLRTWPKFCSFAFRASHSPSTASLLGQVTVDGKGLPGITVSISGRQEAKMLTDANGQYTFTGLRAGNHTVEISCFDPTNIAFSATIASIEVAVGESKVCSFEGTYMRE